MSECLFTPSECLALTAAFSDACKEVELLQNIGTRNFRSTYDTSSSKKDQSKPDDLLTELNRIFFQTLFRYEKARSEDYLELPDGTYRRLNDDESTRVKYLEIVSKVSSTLKRLLLEIDESGTFTSLDQFNQQEQMELDKLANFVASAASKEKELSKIQQEIQNLKRDILRESAAFAETIRHLKHEFQELREMSVMTIQYKKKEYAARLQELLTSHTDQLRLANSSVEHVKSVISQTTRVGEETCAWMCSDIASKFNLSTYVPTNDLTGKVSQMLAQKKKDLENRQALHQDLKNQFEKCTDIVRVYERESEAKRIREEYAEKALMSVIQIQSWWRTMIVQRGIRLRKKRKGKKGQDGKQVKKEGTTKLTSEP